MPGPKSKSKSRSKSKKSSKAEHMDLLSCDAFVNKFSVVPQLDEEFDWLDEFSEGTCKVIKVERIESVTITTQGGQEVESKTMIEFQMTTAYGKGNNEKVKSKSKSKNKSKTKTIEKFNFLGYWNDEYGILSDMQLVARQGGAFDTRNKKAASSNSTFEQGIIESMTQCNDKSTNAHTFYDTNAYPNQEPMLKLIQLCDKHMRSAISLQLYALIEPVDKIKIELNKLKTKGWQKIELIPFIHQLNSIGATLKNHNPRAPDYTADEFREPPFKRQRMIGENHNNNIRNENNNSNCDELEDSDIDRSNDNSNDNNNTNSDINSNNNSSNNSNNISNNINSNDCDNSGINVDSKLQSKKSKSKKMYMCPRQECDVKSEQACVVNHHFQTFCQSKCDASLLANVKQCDNKDCAKFKHYFPAPHRCSGKTKTREKAADTDGNDIQCGDCIYRNSKNPQKYPSIGIAKIKTVKTNNVESYKLICSLANKKGYKCGWQRTVPSDKDPKNFDLSADGASLAVTEAIKTKIDGQINAAT